MTIFSALILKVLVLSSNVATVDRVENDRAPVAVVCTADACINVPTVAGPKGLTEGQLIPCETFTRGDGTRAVVCQGHTVAFIGVDGTRHANPYATPASYQGSF